VHPAELQPLPAAPSAPGRRGTAQSYPNRGRRTPASQGAHPAEAPPHERGLGRMEEVRAARSISGKARKRVPRRKADDQRSEPDSPTQPVAAARPRISTTCMRLPRVRAPMRCNAEGVALRTASRYVLRMKSNALRGETPMTSVDILEVAPRDGFQAVRPFTPTETKIALIEELAACGFCASRSARSSAPRRWRRWPTHPRSSSA
jgi:hypothetical protein